MRKRKRRVYSFISYLLAFTMTFSTLTPFAEAEENTPSSANVPQAETTEGDATVTPNVTENGGDNPSTTENVEHTEDTSTSTPAETSEVEPVTSSNTEQEPVSSSDPYPKEKEVKSLRTETAKVYENSDGTYTAEVFTEPIHFKQNGQWVNIDNTLVETQQQELENKANRFKVKFPKKPKQNEQAKLFTYEIAGHKVTVELSDDSSTKPKAYKGTVDVAGTFKKNRAQYKHLYPGVTFDYVLDGTKVKENIILDSYQGKNTFEFHIKAQGLKAEKKESGVIEFTDVKTGKFLFYIQRPFMYDSSKEGNVSEQVTQEITPVDDGFILTVTADESYLTDPKRVYPVVIDPWIDVFQAQDTFVASGTSSNYGNLNYLSVGKDPTLGKTRTYLKWTLPTIPNAKVTGASVGVYQYVPNSSTPAGPSISLHQVTSAFNASIINWSTQPSFDPTPVSTKSETKAGYNYFAVSDLVKGWYDGTVPNYGVVLKTDDAQEATAAQKLFHSTEWNSSDGSPYGKPKLVISYRSKKLLGITDYWTYTPDLFNGEGTAVVNVINGNMVYDIPVLSLPGRTDAFNLKMVYNSRSDFEDVYGYRWTFSAQRKLIPNSDKTIVEYIDENGTHYHFNKQQYDTGTSYSAPEGTFFEFNSTADGGYTLKEPDETVYYFDSLGRNTKVVDEKGNTILYTFDGTSNRITKISERYGSETTGRDISLAYDPATGLLQKITDFRGTETTFTYDNLNGHNRLRTIIYAANRPERKTITFEYNDQQQLISITDGNGNKGKFEYDDLNRVWKIIDPRSDTIFAELTYLSVNETIFKDANGNQTYYKSNIDQDLATVNVVEIIEDYQGANPSTTKYEWKNNEITKVIEPNKDTGAANGPTTSANYDDKGNLTNLTAPDNETETNTYDSKSNLTSSTTSSGLSEQNVYDSVSNLLFSTNHVGLTDYFTYDRYGNAVTEVTPTSTLYNPVVNANFESVGTNNLPTDWLVRTGSEYAVSSDHVFGTRSAKITLTGTEGSRYYYQDVPINTTLADKTYTVAGYIKTTNVTGAGARIRVYFKDVNNQYIKDQAGNTIVYGSPYVTGTRDWMPISHTFTAPSNTAYIHIECIFTGAGTAYFDGIQLDQGAIVTEYASNENVSMEAGSGTTLDNWTLNAFGTGDGRTTEQAKAGQYSVKINGVSNASRYVGQLVSVSGKKDDPLTLSGWAYVKNPNTSGEFSLQLSFVYTDGTTGTFTIPFNKTLTDQWQFVKKTFRAAKDFNQAKIYGVYNNQAGTVYFDNIKLEEKASTSTTTYSADGNFVTSETDELNQTTSYGYDANGNQTSVTTPGGRNTTYTYTYLDQLKSVTLVDPSGQQSITTSYTYDTQGNLKTRIDPRNNVTTFDYNAINQLTLEQDPLGKFIKYDYDNSGNLKTIEKGKGTTTLSKQEFQYDRKNQLTEKWVNDQKIASYTYDYAGNMTSIEANGQTYSYTYDTYNRLKTSQEPDGYQLQNNYVTDPNSKSNGLRSSYVETIGGNSYTTTFGYDTLQRLSSIQVPTGQTTEFYYNEKGLPIRTNVKNSANTSSFSVYQSYDDAGRLTGQHVVGADALDLTYAYDADGNIVNYFDGTNPHTFTYDFANRLKSWTYQGNTVQYDYDAAGNLKNPHGKTLTFNAANEVEGFTYDEAGNLLQDDKYQYEWDGEGHLLTVKDLNGNTLASFTYHPNGLRKTKTVNGVTYHYHYDGSDLIRITDDNGQTVWAFTWVNGKPNTVTNSNGDTFYYVTNYRGDVVRIVNENGATVASYSYDPWGKVLSVSEDAAVAGQPFGYAGYYYDKETKLYYLQARYYDPETARFISRDPDPGDKDDPITQNGYTYANNNPVMMVDPDGHWAWLAINAAFAAYDGYKAFKRGGWKAAAIAVGVGLVGGAAFKAFRAAQIAKGPARYWYKGTFKNSIESLAYHHNKHVIRKGRSYSPERYTKLARAFYRSNKHLREEVTLSTGKKGYRIKKGKVGGYYTKRGKIVTFWHNGWKLKK